jgi:sulfatase modifying factor 1
MTFTCTFFLCLLIVSASNAADADNSDSQKTKNAEPHPDPNDEDHEDMVYVGRLDAATGRRLGHDVDNSIRYLFGTSFDDKHKDILEEDLQHEHYGPDALNDIAGNRDHKKDPKTREQVLQERRHNKVDKEGPKAFGHVDINELDGGVTPVKAVRVDPFFLDVALVTNREFSKFVQSTYYETEAEKFGWSFVLASFVTDASILEHSEVDPDAPDWIAVEGAYWRRPEGTESSYKWREFHPVIHVSHRDAAEYCTWVGKRLPGEREWEAAARAGYYGPNNRTLYKWGDSTEELEPGVGISTKHANLWGPGKFPWENTADDGFRGTSPVRIYKPNAMGFYDMTGNVWEWMRGGKHKARIVRGASYVDSLDGSFNHAATLGARSTLHGTTTTGNVGFRCAKSPKRRTEHHWTYHDEELHGTLAVEDEFGKRDMIPQRGWEDQFNPDDDDDDEDETADNDEFVASEKTKPRKRKVIKKREVISTEL